MILGVGALVVALYVYIMVQKAAECADNLRNDEIVGNFADRDVLMLCPTMAAAHTWLSPLAAVGVLIIRNATCM